MSTPPSTARATYQPVAAARGFVADVFGWMFVGLGITAALAAFFASQNNMLEYFDAHPAVIWGVIIAQLVLVVVLIGGVNKLSANAARVIFCLYAATIGFTFSIIFEEYTSASIAGTFVVSAGMFGGAAAFGWITKKDLTRVGQVCLFLIIGVFLALVVNIFLGSSTLDFVVSGIGVLLFTALTAYDLQKIKQQAAMASGGSEAERKAAIYGALMLYLNFINIFLFLLRFMGVSR